MKVALVIHVYYEDIWSRIAEHLSKLKPFGAIYITTGECFDLKSIEMLKLKGWTIFVKTCRNEGWDIGPFLEIIPEIIAEGIDLVCKIHTKKGRSGFAVEWREICYRTLIGSDITVSGIIDVFRDERIAILGPADLYKSYSSHIFANGPIINDLLPRLFERDQVPSDWGFFCGTMFWCRPQAIASLAEGWQNISRNQQMFEKYLRERDAHPAHAFERFFGLVPVMSGMSIGLVSTPLKSELSKTTVALAPATPSNESIIETLSRARVSFLDEVSQEDAQHGVNENPLLHFIRNGVDIDVPDPNPYFNAGWYLANNADVLKARLNPLRHFLKSASKEKRHAGPRFDTRFYLDTNPDVVKSKVNPLIHYLENGLREERRARRRERTPNWPEKFVWPVRVSAQFDRVREAAFLRTIVHTTEGLGTETFVSVIMPAYNRAASISKAIESVLLQTHTKFELIIVDDGSSDETEVVVSKFQSVDSRIKFFSIDHRGVSAARNRGLEASNGEIIAYLDSDNAWKPNFISVMLAFMQRSNLDCAYSGMELHDDENKIFGFRGDYFDWQSCLDENYVDLNVFCHRRSLYESFGGFDVRLRRMVDWDLILRYTKNSRVNYAPFIGCEYKDGSADTLRITKSEPVAFRSIVRAKHRGTTSLSEQIKTRFSIAIKVPCPENGREEWGDYHFGNSLAEALRKHGHLVHVDVRERWYERSASHEDIVICLRGLVAYKPRGTSINLLWIISHPDQISYEEIECYDVCFVASHSYAQLLKEIVSKPVFPLLQATDEGRFGGSLPDLTCKTEVLFVGNSRNEYRNIVRWAIECEAQLAVFGTRWDQFIPREYIKGEYIKNEDLGVFYSSAHIVLNDHWDSMREFGIVSNRIFDVIASGGRVISDSIPAIRRIFGPSVAMVSGSEALKAAIQNPPEGISKNARNKFIMEHGFGARAKVICDVIDTHLGLTERPLEAPFVNRYPDQPMRIHVICRRGSVAWQSSAYIRLMAPLTWDNESLFELSWHRENNIENVEDGDICIVQRSAIDDLKVADELIYKVKRKGISLVFDNDDAFQLMDETHSEYGLYESRIKAMNFMLEAADQCWVSTENLRKINVESNKSTFVVANALDPRLWRDYRRRRREPWSGGKIHVLYMGTVTHDADFEMILPALDAIANMRKMPFQVHVVGAVSKLPQRPWLKRLSPPSYSTPYPKFVRWLSKQQNFDVGISPLVDNAFNSCKSDIKFLDYSALGIPSILSNVEAYSQTASGVPFAFLADNSTDAWINIFLHVIERRFELAELGEQAYNFVWKERSVEGMSKLQRSLLSNLKKP